VKRLDQWLVENGFFASRERAQASIIAGEIWQKGQRLEKAGSKVDESAPIEVRSRIPDFSSRAGHKLEKALDVFAVDVSGQVVMDIGASTGGFTDCLLKRGAERVIAVDVGYGQLDQKLRENPKVTNLERVNARYLTAAQIPIEFKDRIDLVTMDVSFISSKLILSPIAKAFPLVKKFIVLFKPQFEVGKKFIGKGGLVKDEAAIETALQSYLTELSEEGFHLLSPVETSPISGKKSGNVERLLFLGR
jgi:23S rRNA (cytidine1920-2'-O)/16S rRNA (cytidine1409-2'-O)-methyltransferase